MEGTRRGAGEGGYLTVYLTITLMLMVSLCLALIEGVRSNAIRVETECVTEIGMNSILAEYHRELLEQYNLFAVDSSYGTASSGVEDITKHLQGYLEKNFTVDGIFLSDFLYKDFLAIEVDSIQMTAGSILTDGRGAVFRKRAIEAIRDDCNLTLLEELQQWMQVVEDNGLDERDVATEKQIIDNQIQAYDGREIQISETEWHTIDVQNPTEALEQIRNKGILEYVVQDTASLSGKTLQMDTLILSRMEMEQINQGNMEVTDSPEGESLIERFFFQEYLLRYLGHYSQEKDVGALSYQMEYLIAGKESDIENLKHVINILCAVREAANAIYIFSDTEKCAQAEAVATVISSLLMVPEIATLLKSALLLGWAYAESLYDVEVLLQGGRIPLMKDKTTWHYDIQGALQLVGRKETADSGTGLSYEDYLRLFMTFVDLDSLTGRAMNMVEADIRLTPGNHFFRLDNCYDRVVFCMQVKSKYGYTYQITRQKGY